MKFVYFAALTIFTLASAIGFAQTPVASPVAPNVQPMAPAKADRAVGADLPHDLLIGAGDLLEVNLYGMPDFKTDARVNSEGEILLPMLGTVSVKGLSAEQAAKQIEHKLIEKGLFNNPHIIVFQKEYATQGIAVGGEVQKPGIYPLLGSRRLYEVLSAAGGTTPKAGSYALISHRSDPEHTRRVPLLTGAPESLDNDVAVAPGDTIIVSKAGVIYVVGDVRQPGGFILENGNNITVLQAIALAQGIGPNPALNSSRLIRKTPAGPKETPLELSKILATKAPDLQLQPEDIVFVPGSAGKGAAKRGAEAILQMATGMAIWRVP
jgi:polysaccharide biosynthesis/export protein